MMTLPVTNLESGDVLCDAVAACRKMAITLRDADTQTKMMKQWLKKVASKLPVAWQLDLKRWYFRGQIRRNNFVTSEPEFAILDTLIKPGDWTIDVGANIGHYTKRLSDLCGADGRVLAFEPIPETFALLASNVTLFTNANVTLLNFAASSRMSAAGMEIPSFDIGLKNYYEASISASGAGMQVLTLKIDSLEIERKISLVKIDVEEHEAQVLEGMAKLLERDHPTLIVETGSNDVIQMLESRYVYRSERLPDSPNVLFRYEKGG